MFVAKDKPVLGIVIGEGVGQGVDGRDQTFMRLGRGLGNQRHPGGAGLAVGNIRLDRMEPHEVAGVVAHRLDVEFHPVAFARPADIQQFRGDRRPGVERVPDALHLGLVGFVALHEIAGVAADDLLGGVAAALFERLVDPGDPAVRIGDDDKVVGPPRDLVEHQALGFPPARGADIAQDQDRAERRAPRRGFVRGGGDLDPARRGGRVIGQFHQRAAALRPIAKLRQAATAGIGEIGRQGGIERRADQRGGRGGQYVGRAAMGPDDPALDIDVDHRVRYRAQRRA